MPWDANGQWQQPVDNPSAYGNNNSGGGYRAPRDEGPQPIASDYLSMDPNAGADGSMTTGQGINERAGYDVGAWRRLPAEVQAQYYRYGGAPGQQQGGGAPQMPENPTLDSLTEYFRQAGPADGDAAYWARQSMEKIGRGAGVQDTLSYMTNRSDFKTLGGDGRGSGGGQGGGFFTPLQPFTFDQFNYSDYNAPTYDAPGQVQPNTPFSYDTLATPSAYQVGSLNAPTSRSYSQVPQIDRFTNRGQMAAPTPFSYDTITMPDQLQYEALTPFASYGAPASYSAGTFKAPTAEELYEDPSYQFRVDQGRKALESSAASRGVLLSGATGKAITDYGQQAASQEYANVYGRRFNEFQQKEAEALAAAGFNEDSRRAGYTIDTQTKLAQQQQGYGQASDTYRTNLDALLRGDAQAYQEEAGIYSMNQGLARQAAQDNFQNDLAGYTADTGTQLARQQQEYGQQFNTDQTNWQNYTDWQRANEALRQAGYQINADTQLGYNQNQYNQAYNTWSGNSADQLNRYNTNEGARLAAFQANAGAKQGAASLNAQGRLGAWQANTGTGFNAYESMVNQALAAAGYSVQGRQLDMQAQNQGFNQNLASYTTNRDTYWGDSDRTFNRTYAYDNMGYNAANSANAYGAGYAGSMGDLYTGRGNAQAAGTVGAQNAWTRGVGSATDAGLGMAYYYGTPQPQRQTTPRSTPAGAPSTWTGLVPGRYNPVTEPEF